MILSKSFCAPASSSSAASTTAMPLGSSSSNLCHPLVLRLDDGGMNDRVQFLDAVWEREPGELLTIRSFHRHLGFRGQKC